METTVILKPVTIICVTKIRHGVFETNSSSTHSISINSRNTLYESITPDENDTVKLTVGQFGWDWNRYNDPNCGVSMVRRTLTVVKERPIYDEHQKFFMLCC